MNKELVIYQPKILSLSKNWQFALNNLPTLKTKSFNYEEWLRLLKQIESDDPWLEQRKIGYRYYPRVDFRQAIQLFDLDGHLLEDANMRNFSPRGLQIIGEKPVNRQQIVLVSGPGFRAAGEIKYSQGMAMGCEFLALRLLQSHFLLDVKV